MRNPEKTIFFDLDGTLTDSAPGIVNSVAHALKAMGHPLLPPDVMRRFVGPPLPDAFHEHCGWDGEKALEAVAHFRSYYVARGMWENSPYPGVKEMLADLCEAGACLRIATSKPEPFAEKILQKFGLRPFFSRLDGASLDEAISADKTTVLKKAVAGCPPAGRAYMVGDRKYDILGGRAAGLSTVAVLYGYGAPEELQAAAPDHTVPTVAALRALLKSL